MFSHAAASQCGRAGSPRAGEQGVSVAPHLPCRSQPGVDQTLGKVRQSIDAAHPCMLTAVLFQFGSSAPPLQLSFVVSVYLHLLPIHLFLLHEASTFCKVQVAAGL